MKVWRGTEIPLVLSSIRILPRILGRGVRLTDLTQAIPWALKRALEAFGFLMLKYAFCLFLLFLIFDQGCLDLDIVRHHGKRSVCVGHYQTRVTKNVTTKCYNKSDQNKLHFICLYLFPVVYSVDLIPNTV